MARPTIWIRTADGEVREIPKRNWWAHQARGAVRTEKPEPKRTRKRKPKEPKQTT